MMGRLFLAWSPQLLPWEDRRHYSRSDGLAKSKPPDASGWPPPSALSDGTTSGEFGELHASNTIKMATLSLALGFGKNLASLEVGFLGSHYIPQHQAMAFVCGCILPPQDSIQSVLITLNPGAWPFQHFSLDRHGRKYRWVGWGKGGTMRQPFYKFHHTWWWKKTTNNLNEFSSLISHSSLNTFFLPKQAFIFQGKMFPSAINQSFTG